MAPSRAADTSDRSEGITLAIDSARREVCLRLSYISAGITGAALVVILVFAYFIGRQVGSAPRPFLTKEPTPKVRTSQPDPRVLTLAKVEDTPGGSDSGAPRPASNGAGAPPRGNVVEPPPTLVVDDSHRQAELNYVVVQSYPNEQMAGDACDLLKKNGITATVERGLKGWGASWFCVVGTKGFAKISSPEYKTYVSQIKAISDKNMTVRSFKAFQPQAYKWGGER